MIDATKFVQDQADREPLFDRQRNELLARVIPRLQRYMVVRERSSGEVADFLRKKKLCAGDELDTVLTALREDGLVDDRRFARARVEYRLGEGCGLLYIRADLAKCLVPRALADETLAAVDEAAWLAAAHVTLRKAARRAAGRDEPELALRNALRYRGFSHGLIEKALRASREQADQNED